MRGSYSRSGTVCVCALLCVSLCVDVCVCGLRAVGMGRVPAAEVCVCDAGYYPKLATSDCVWWTADIFSLWAAVARSARVSAAGRAERVTCVRL